MVKDCFFVVLIAFVVRGAFLIGIGPKTEYAVRPDSHEYISLSRQLRDNGRFSLESDHGAQPEISRTPGYPLFLSMFFDQAQFLPRMAQWGQALIGAFSAGVLFALSFAFWKDRKIAWVAGLAMAVDWVSIVTTAFIVTEVFFVFALTVWLWGFLRLLQSKAVSNKRGFLLGMGLGLLALIRPIAMYASLFLLITVALFRLFEKNGKYLKAAGMIFLGSALVMGLWMARNHTKTGQWVFTSIGGANIREVRAVFVEMKRSGASYGESREHLRRRMGDDADKVGPYIRFILSQPKALARVLLKDSLQFFVGNSMKPTAWMLAKDEQFNPRGFSTLQKDGLASQAINLIKRHPVIGLGMVLYIGFLFSVYGLSLYGVFRIWREKGPTATVWVVFPILYFFLVTIGAGAMSRYRLPAMPVFFLLAAGGMGTFYKKENQRT